jgi:hypothetical protein
MADRFRGDTNCCAMVMNDWMQLEYLAPFQGANSNTSSYPGVFAALNRPATLCDRFAIAKMISQNHVSDTFVRLVRMVASCVAN